MVEDYQRSLKRLKINVILGCTFFAGLFGCFPDFDHIPLFIFKIKLGWFLPNILWQISFEGRNLHSLYFWIPANIIISGMFAPFLARLVKSKVVIMKKDLQWRKKKLLDKERRKKIEYELKLARFHRNIEDSPTG